MQNEYATMEKKRKRGKRMKSDFGNWTNHKFCGNTLTGGGLLFRQACLYETNGECVIRITERTSRAYRLKFCEALAGGGDGSLWHIRVRVRLGEGAGCEETEAAIGIMEPSALTPAELAATVRISKNEWSVADFLYRLTDGRNTAISVEQPNSAALAEEILIGSVDTECLEKGTISAADERTKLFLIGDSIMADYPIKPEGSLRGWGMYLGEAFQTERLMVCNCARRGFSTKSFLDTEGLSLWKSLGRKLKKGDYLLVSLGINDHSSVREWQHTTPEEYAHNLARFADEAAACGAETIFVTPTVTANNDPIDNFRVIRADTMKRVAAEKGCVCLDLNTVMLDAMRRFAADHGYDALLDAYFGVMTDKEGNVKPDKTHLREAGARWVASLVIGLLDKSDSSLRQYRIREREDLKC